MLEQLKEVIQQLPEFSGVDDLIQKIEMNVCDDSVFDHCKSTVDTICKTILANRGILSSVSDDSPALFRAANDCLTRGILGSGSSKMVIAGLATSFQGVCELRNTFGSASHGKDLFGVGASQVHRRLAVDATDTVCSCLLRLYKFSYSPSEQLRIQYEANPEFNSWLDESYQQAMIADFTFLPSDVLYNCDQVGYREMLIVFKEGNEEADPPEI